MAHAAMSVACGMVGNIPAHLQVAVRHEVAWWRAQSDAWLLKRCQSQDAGRRESLATAVLVLELPTCAPAPQIIQLIACADPSCARHGCRCSGMAVQACAVFWTPD